MIRRPPRSTLSSSSAASDVYKRQGAGVRGGAVPQLAAAVVAPGPDGAVAAQRVPGVSAAGDGGGAGEPGDLHRGAGVGGRAVPQLAVVVVAPGPDGAVAAQRVPGVGAAGNGGGPGEPGDLHRGARRWPARRMGRGLSLIHISEP